MSPQLSGGSGKIGVRLVGHPAAAALIRAARVPISGTSANISAHGGCSRTEELDPEIATGVDLILDAGPLFGGAGSTVVDVTVDPPKVLREGCVTSGEIFNCLGE